MFKNFHSNDCRVKWLSCLNQNLWPHRNQLSYICFLGKMSGNTPDSVYRTLEYQIYISSLACYHSLWNIYIRSASDYLWLEFYGKKILYSNYSCLELELNYFFLVYVSYRDDERDDEKNDKKNDKEEMNDMIET